MLDGDKQVEHDCGIKIDNQRFRYRAAAIIVEDGHVLLMNNGKDQYYYSVGGGVHIGETAEDAVVREVFEETGLVYEVDKLAAIHQNFWIGKGTYDKGWNCHEVTLYFLMKPNGTKGKIKRTEENPEITENAYWLPIEDLNNLRYYPQFLGEYLKDTNQEILNIVTDDRIKD